MKINLREGGGNSDALTIMIHISRLRFVIVSPRLLHCISIDNPSHLHRLSIETMEYRWTNDGVSSEEERRQMPGMMGDFSCYVRQKSARYT